MLERKTGINIKDVTIDAPPRRVASTESAQFDPSDILIPKDFKLWEQLSERLRRIDPQRWLNQLANLKIVAPDHFVELPWAAANTDEMKEVIRKKESGKHLPAVAWAHATALIAAKGAKSIYMPSDKTWARLVRHINSLRGHITPSDETNNWSEFFEEYAHLKIINPGEAAKIKLPHVAEEKIIEHFQALKSGSTSDYLQEASLMKIAIPDKSHIYRPTKIEWDAIKEHLRTRTAFGLKIKPEALRRDHDLDLRPIEAYFTQLAQATILAADEIHIPADGGLEPVIHGLASYEERIPSMPHVRKF